jgi:Rrf2 family protein
MSNIVQLSEASSLAIHAMVIIARNDKIINANKIAEMTGASRNHLAKIMLILTKKEFVRSLRGPSGGFVLNKEADAITILEIYEAIEGNISIQKCPSNKNICPFKKCIFKNVFHKVTIEIKDFFKNNTLKDYI